MKERNIFKFPETFNVQCLIKSPKQYEVSDLIKVIGNKILGYNTANITVQYKDDILDKYSTTDCELQALLDKTVLPHTYNLLIRNRLQASLRDIICHEMKHFDQYERGDLEIIKDDDQITFSYKGKIYDSSVDYYSRPWEEEARAAECEL